MKILIAVEDKQCAEAITAFMCGNRNWNDKVEFRVMHVVEPLYIGAISGYQHDVLTSFIEERQRAGRSLVLSVGTELRQHYPSAEIQEDVVDGHAKQVLIETAKTWPADLIVVGSHGRSGLSQFLLGSVSMSVLSAAPCSVMAVKLPAETTSQDAKTKEATLAK